MKANVFSALDIRLIDGDEAEARAAGSVVCHLSLFDISIGKRNKSVVTKSK
jgi:hypothetical protein